jgi:hypothetical protein
VFNFGADIKGNDLIIVCVEEDDGGALVYCDAKSIKLSLISSDQEGIKALHKAVAGFVAEHGISKITARGRAVGGGVHPALSTSRRPSSLR